jgi:signal peptidase I
MKPNAPTTQFLFSSLLASALGASLFLSGCTTAYHPYRVVGESMLPLLRPADRIFVDQSDQARSGLHDGEIIVLRRDDAVVLKRIMAMPGETISGDNRKIFRNGKQLDEPYLAPASKYNIPALVTFAPRMVGSGELFVMGDNRDLSFDSRASEYAPVRLSDVVGQYRWTYWHTMSAAK